MQDSPIVGTLFAGSIPALPLDHSYYQWQQHIDRKGRPRGKIKYGAWQFVTGWLTKEQYEQLTHCALSDTARFDAHAEYGRSDGQGIFVTAWGTGCYIVKWEEEFDARGTNGKEPSARARFTLAPEEMGRQAGSKGEFIAPVSRDYPHQSLNSAEHIFRESESNSHNESESLIAKEIEALPAALSAMLGVSLLIERAGYDDEGPDLFEERVKADLNQLYSTPTGRRLLESIHASGKSVTIQYALDGVNKAFVPESEVDLCRYQEDGITPGAGNSIKIAYAPLSNRLGDEEDWQSRPPGIGLAHELIHAEQAAYGRMRRGTTDNPGSFIENDQDEFDQVPIMELETVGVPPYDGYHVNENKIRAEWIPPQPSRRRY